MSDLADYAEFPIKQIERIIERATTRFYLERPSGQVFPLRVGQLLTFDTWSKYSSIILGGAVGEGWIELTDEDYSYARHHLGIGRPSEPTILIRPWQIALEGTWEGSSVSPIHARWKRR